MDDDLDKVASFLKVLKIRIIKWPWVCYNKDVGMVVSTGDTLGGRVVPDLLLGHHRHSLSSKHRTIAHVLLMLPYL